MSGRTRWVITLTGLVAAMVVASPEAMAGMAPQQELAPLRAAAGKTLAGRYIVVLKAGSTAKGDLRAGADAPAIARARGGGAKVEHEFRHALHGYSAALTAEQLAKVRKDPDVAYVEPDQIVSAGNVSALAQEDNAPWNLDRIDQHGSQLDGRYTYTADGSGVAMYVIDSGIRNDHVDFFGRVFSGHDSTGGDGLGTPDCNGHGTHVAGTIGSFTFGVAKYVPIIPVKVLTCDAAGNAVGTLAQVIDGVDWVTAQHVSPFPAVANMSLGGAAAQSLDDAVERSIAVGVTYVVAAGDDNADACTRSPARAPSAVAVGWTDGTDNRNPQSNWGSCVDVFAPGSNIVSAYYGSATALALGSGSSMASAHVAGAAALYLQRNPTATPAQVRAAITGTATPGVVKDAHSSPNRLLYTPGVTKVATPAGPSSPDRVKSGEALLRYGGAASTITSPDGRFTLKLQDFDGNLVLYEYGRRALWASGVKGSPDWFTNQPDGNVVSYRADNVFSDWASNTYGQGRSTLVLQDDGNVVLYRDSDHRAIWSTGTCCHAPAPPQPAANSDRLATGQALVRGGVRLTSPNGTYTLVLQDLDGNLVLYKNGTQPLWAFGPRANSWFINQPDGNLVSYKSEGGSGGVAWASNTYGKGPGTLVLQDDGNLVLYRTSDHGVIWATNTYGR